MGRAEDILKGLASLRKDNILCDVQLQVDGQKLAAHRAVLAAASPYFVAMFSGQFKETTDQVVQIKEISFTGLKNIIDCIYTTKINITMKNIEDILPAAHLLQLPDIENECKTWMQKKITKSNCFKFLELAEKFNIDTLEKVITGFILHNFVVVSENKAFSGISKQALIKYISSDSLKTNIDEMAAYKACKNWILANEVPAEDVAEILACVRFGLIPPKTILKDISPTNLIQNNPECRKLISNAMLYHTDVFAQPTFDGRLNKPRGHEGVLLIPIGTRGEGFNVTDDKVNVEFLSFPGLKNSQESSSLDIPLVYDSMSSVKIGNFLYVFGTSNSGYQNFTKRYDATVDSWLDLASVPWQATIGSAVAHLNNQIFLLGGMIVDHNTNFKALVDKCINHVYMYKILDNTWSETCAMPVPLMYAAAAELQGSIFVSGGYSNDGETTAGVRAFDVGANLWLTKASMNHKRCQHILQSIDEKLYAFGGRLVEEDDDHVEDDHVGSVEMYLPLSNQWSLVLMDAIETASPSSFVIGHQIYLLGGTRNIAHVYDTKKKKMSKMDRELPKNCFRNMSAFMVLPKLL